MLKYFVTLVASVLLLSCVSEERVEVYNKHIVFEGKIENTNISSFQLFKQTSAIDWRFVDSIQLNADNTFKYTFEDSLSDYYRMTSKDFDVNLYLSPKDSLILNFDAKDVLLTVKYKGEHGKHENRYLAGKKFFVEKYITDSLYQLPENEFHEQLKFIKKEFMFALNEANIKQSDFRARERRAIAYIQAKIMVNYPYINHLISEGQVGLTSDYYNFKTAVLEEFDGCLEIPEYVDFYTNLILYDLEEAGDFSKPAFQKVIEKYFKNPEHIKEMNRILF